MFLFKKKTVEPAKTCCEICEGPKKSEAEFYCGECKGYFCQVHSEYFHSRGAFRLHSVSKLSTEKSFICASHNKSLEFICEESGYAASCFDCAASHKNHCHIPIDEAFKIASESLIKNRDTYEGLYSQVQSTIERLIDEIKSNPARQQDYINDYKNECDELSARNESLRESSAKEISSIGEMRSQKLRDMITEFNAKRLRLEGILELVEKKRLNFKSDMSMAQIMGALYLPKGELNLERTMGKVNEARALAKYRPRLVVLGSLNSIGATKLVLNSYIDFSETPEFFSKRRYALPIVLKDDFGKVYDTNDDYYLQVTLLGQQQDKRPDTQLLVNAENNKYYVEAVFDVGLSLIDVKLNGTPFAKSPFKVEVLPGVCGCIRDEMYFCKGALNGCLEVNKNDLYLYGTNPYLANNPVNYCKAALHSGMINRSGGKFIMLMKDLTDATYQGSTKNGIMSYDYGSKITAKAVHIKPLGCGFLENSVVYACVGEENGCKGKGAVFGSGPYHHSSDLCKALQHSGKVGTFGGTAKVLYKNFKGKLKASKENKVQSQSLEIDQEEKVFEFAHGTCCKINNNLFFCVGINYGCSCVTKDYVWGSNPYTEDADMCGCAVHAGVIGKEGGYFKMKRMPNHGQNFTATTKNGFTSKFWNAPYNGVYLEKYEG